MTEALFDFGTSHSEGRVPSMPHEIPIKDHQVQQIRAEFDLAGIADQASRRDTIQSLVKREVVSLRDLTASEAHEAIARLRSLNAPKQERSGSAWDQREEETWIDKL